MIKLSSIINETAKNILLPIFQGRNMHNRNSHFFTIDKEWARQFTQSGQEDEIFIAKINVTTIYRHEPLPEATNAKQLDEVEKIAKKRGFPAFWVDEGVDQPPSVFVINMNAIRIIKHSSIKESFGDKTPLQIETDSFMRSLIQQHPQLDDLHFYITYNPNVLHLSTLKVRKEFRNQGIGSKVLTAIKEFADKRGLFITLSPQAESRYKKKLDMFYKSHGFIPNRGRKKDYRLSSFFGPIMFRKPEQKKLTESFELPSEMNIQSEKLAKFIASLFLKDLRKEISNTKRKADYYIVKYHESYRLATQYRNEGKPLFGVIRDDEPTDWGEASLRIYSKNDVLPDALLFMTNNYHMSNDGYMESIEDPQKIVILVSRDNFVEQFKQSTEELISTVKHEIRHWYQAT